MTQKTLWSENLDRHIMQAAPYSAAIAMGVFYCYLVMETVGSLAWGIVLGSFGAVGLEMGGTAVFILAVKERERWQIGMAVLYVLTHISAITAIEIAGLSAVYVVGFSLIVSAVLGYVAKGQLKTDLAKAEERAIAEHQAEQERLRKEQEDERRRLIEKQKKLDQIEIDAARVKAEAEAKAAADAAKIQTQALRKASKGVSKGVSKEASNTAGQVSIDWSELMSVPEVRHGFKTLTHGEFIDKFGQVYGHIPRSTFYHNRKTVLNGHG